MRSLYVCIRKGVFKNSHLVSNLALCNNQNHVITNHVIKRYIFVLYDFLAPKDPFFSEFIFNKSLNGTNISLYLFFRTVPLPQVPEFAGWPVDEGFRSSDKISRHTAEPAELVILWIHWNDAGGLYHGFIKIVLALPGYLSLYFANYYWTIDLIPFFGEVQNLKKWRQRHFIIGLLVKTCVLPSFLIFFSSLTPMKFVSKIYQEIMCLGFWNSIQMFGISFCIVWKRINLLLLIVPFICPFLSSPERKAHWWAYRIDRPPSSIVVIHSSNVFS